MLDITSVNLLLIRDVYTYAKSICIYVTYLNSFIEFMTMTIIRFLFYWNSVSIFRKFVITSFELLLDVQQFVKSAEV